MAAGGFDGKVDFRGGSRSLKGVAVRINEKCLPPARVTLPINFEASNPSELLFLEYEFGLEEQVVAFSEVIRQKWEEEISTIRQDEEDAARAGNSAVASDDSDQGAKGVDAKTAVSSDISTFEMMNGNSEFSNTHLSGVAMKSAHANINNSHSVGSISSTVSQSQIQSTTSSVAAASQVWPNPFPVQQSAPYGQILMPLPVTASSKPSPPKDINVQRLDFKDFETVQDPFEKLELETINDREELRQVLAQTVQNELARSSQSFGKTQSFANVATSGADNLVSGPLQNTLLPQSQNALYRQQANNWTLFQPNVAATPAGKQNNVASFSDNRAQVNGGAMLQNHFGQPRGSQVSGSYIATGQLWQNANPMASSARYELSEREIAFAQNARVHYKNLPQNSFPLPVPISLSAGVLATDDQTPATVRPDQTQRVNVLPGSQWQQDYYGKPNASGFVPLRTDLPAGRILPKETHVSPEPQRRSLRSAKSWTDVREAFREEEDKSKALKSSKTPPPYYNLDQLDRYHSTALHNIHGNVSATECDSGLAYNHKTDNPVNGKSQFSHLSAEAMSLVNRMVDMGFHRMLASRAVDRLGLNDKKVIDHLCLVHKLCERGFKQSDAEAASVQFDHKEDKVIAYLEALRTFREMGFRDDLINKALLSCNLDHEKVLDMLTAS